MWIAGINGSSANSPCFTARKKQAKTMIPLCGKLMESKVPVHKQRHVCTEIWNGLILRRIDCLEEILTSALLLKKTKSYNESRFFLMNQPMRRGILKALLTLQAHLLRHLAQFRFQAVCTFSNLKFLFPIIQSFTTCFVHSINSKCTKVPISQGITCQWSSSKWLIQVRYQQKFNLKQLLIACDRVCIRVWTRKL